MHDEVEPKGVNFPEIPHPEHADEDSAPDHPRRQEQPEIQRVAQMSGHVHSNRVTGEKGDVDFAQFRRPVLAVERSPTGVARTVRTVEVVTFLDEDGSERPWEGQNVVVFGMGVGVENALDDAAGFARGVVAGVGDEGDDQNDVPVGEETPVSASDSSEEQNPRRRSPRRLGILGHWAKLIGTD